jgi:hypothetical protein
VKPQGGVTMKAVKEYVKARFAKRNEDRTKLLDAIKGVFAKHRGEIKAHTDEIKALRDRVEALERRDDAP